MTRARELANLAGVSETALSNRNLVLNGAMAISQRASSTSGITSGDTYPSVDRFMLRVNSAGTWTHSQSTDAPSGFSSSLKMDCTTADASLAADDNVQIQYRFEGQDLQQLDFGSSDAKSLTLSFWVRATKTGTNIVELYQDDGNDHICKSYTINSSNTWEYKTIAFSGNTLASIANDNTRGLIVQFFLAAGSNFQSGTLASSWAGYVQGNEAVGQVNHADSTSNEWYITGVQLEVGDQATPFEHRSYGEELALCQRYTYVFNSEKLGGNDQAISSMSKWSNGYTYGAYNFPCTMRTAPSGTAYNTNQFTIYIAGSTGQPNTELNIENVTPVSCEMNVQTSLGSTGQSRVFRKQELIQGLVLATLYSMRSYNHEYYIG